jgi:hypothetical protein
MNDRSNAGLRTSKGGAWNRRASTLLTAEELGSDWIAATAHSASLHEGTLDADVCAFDLRLRNDSRRETRHDSAMWGALANDIGGSAHFRTHEQF